MKKFIISEEEKSRILGMHHNVFKKEFLFEAEIKVGMVGTGNYSDTAEGKTYSVIKINDLPCGITEVELKNLKSNRTEFAYYKKSEYPDSKNIGFRRDGEGVKSTNPCEEYNSFGDFGKLNFSDSNNNSATTPEQGDKNYVPTQILQAQDKDYYYKKEGDKYYFKLVEEPVSTKAKEFAKQGKFKDWTEAKNPKAIEGISKLNFAKVEKMELKPLSGMSLSDKVTTTGTTVGGGAKPLDQLAGTPAPDLLKQFPNLATLDQATQTKITTWTKSPAGQYILNTPADQREKAMDNLDKIFGGDPLTKELKKPIRQALGMKADNIFGRVASAGRGAVQGAVQGYQQQR